MPAAKLQEIAEIANECLGKAAAVVIVDPTTRAIERRATEESFSAKDDERERIEKIPQTAASVVKR
ncbi:MAG: hypothetical protein M1837_004083 [Sclerophora amabilis]|nr:MAG: hypothetical protein M1837_004083 [Sclerophora amabilis]